MVKEDFQIGKWYKNIGSENNYMAPFVGFDKGDWIIDKKRNFIYNYKYTIDKNSKLLTSCYEEAQECSIEEIKHILPPTHPDLLNIAPKIYELW